MNHRIARCARASRSRRLVNVAQQKRHQANRHLRVDPRTTIVRASGLLAIRHLRPKPTQIQYAVVILGDQPIQRAGHEQIHLLAPLASNHLGNSHLGRDSILTPNHNAGGFSTPLVRGAFLPLSRRGHRLYPPDKGGQGGCFSSREGRPLYPLKRRLIQQPPQGGSESVTQRFCRGRLRTAPTGQPRPSLRTPSQPTRTVQTPFVTPTPRAGRNRAAGCGAWKPPRRSRRSGAGRPLCRVRRGTREKTAGPVLGWWWPDRWERR